MNGIQFIIDDKGSKTAAVIDLNQHGQIWEDFYGGLMVEARRQEEDIPFEDVRAARAKLEPDEPRVNG